MKMHKGDLTPLRKPTCLQPVEQRHLFTIESPLRLASGVLWRGIRTSNVNAGIPTLSFTRKPRGVSSCGRREKPIRIRGRCGACVTRCCSPVRRSQPLGWNFSAPPTVFKFRPFFPEARSAPEVRQRHVSLSSPGDCRCSQGRERGGLGVSCGTLRAVCRTPPSS